MSKSRTESREPGRIVQTAGQTENVAYIRCSPRFLAIVDGICQACDMPMMVPPQGAEIPPLPHWGEKICEQLCKTIFKRLLELRPQDNGINWRNLGKMLGASQRVITFLAEAWKDCESVLPEHATSPAKAAVDGFVMVPQSDLLASMQEFLSGSIVDNLAKNPVEQGEFFAGLSEGHELFLDTNGQFTGDRGRTRVYLELLGRWMEIEKMRESNCTRRELYKLIAPEFGDKTGERWPWFNDVCDEIGLRTTEPGRPSKS